jgi:hypothetical protein
MLSKNVAHINNYDSWQRCEEWRALIGYGHALLPLQQPRAWLIIGPPWLHEENIQRREEHVRNIHAQSCYKYTNFVHLTRKNSKNYHTFFRLLWESKLELD